MDAKKKSASAKAGFQMMFLVITAFVVVVGAGVAVFLRFYNSYIDGILYQERMTQMKEVTGQLFAGLEDVVENRWDSTDAFCTYIETERPETYDSLQAFMSTQSAINKLSEKGTHLVAIDNLGRYCTEGGWQGTLNEMDVLLDAPSHISFVSKSMTSNETFMYFLQRLDEPIILQDGSRTVELIYYGLTQDMEQLNPYFICEAYNNSNSVYVLESQGTRLFSSDNSSSVLRGYNAYAVLEQMEYLHNNSFNEARKELDDTGCGYSNAVLDGEEYYYAMYQMENAEWVLLLLVPSSQVAMNVVTMVNTTVRLILVFAVVLVAIAAFMIIVLMNLKQKQAIELERRNSDKLRDVNEELNEAVQIAEKATKAKSEFLSNMSHDIRTPMNAIVGIVNLMEHEGGLSDKQHTYIQKIQMSSRHLLSLINDVLDMSKIESSEVVLNQEPVSLAEQIGQVESIIRSQTNERGQEFMIRVHELRHEYLIGDSVRLRQIFINLLSNAVKYTPYGGKVELDLAELPCEIKEHATIRITVTDNGCGMPPEFVEHIFEPFTRSENSVTNKVQGTGLGMAITKSIVDMVGGTIEVHSEVDQGSRFDVTLSLPINHSAEKEIHAKSILLVSDDKVLNRNMSASMKEAGVLFAIVSTEEEAVRQLKRQSTDVILIGGHLHDQTLGSTAQLLRRTAKDAVLIFCCDYAQREKIVDILQKSGVDGLIARPFFLSNLINAIDHVRENVPVVESHSLLQGMRFLCAEDNELNAEILDAILEMNGASCTICSNGEKIVEAFRKVQPGDYDAILMDVQMPRMNGLEAARAIRQSENQLGREIPIIAMTANAFAEDVQACLNAGMDAHVSKPLEINMLEQALRNTGKFSGGGTTVRL